MSLWVESFLLGPRIGLHYPVLRVKADLISMASDRYNGCAALRPSMHWMLALYDLATGARPVSHLYHQVFLP